MLKFSHCRSDELVCLPQLLIPLTIIHPFDPKMLKTISCNLTIKTSDAKG